MEKNKFISELLSQPHEHLRHVKLKNILREATNDWLLAETHLTVRCQTQRREGYSTHESEPRGNTSEIRMFFTLGLQTLMDELQPQLGYVELSKKFSLVWFDLKIYEASAQVTVYFASRKKEGTIQFG